MIVSAVKILLLILWSALCATIILLLLPFNKGGRMFHFFSRMHARGSLAIGGVELKVEGLDRVDFSRSYIYVSNHASLFDIPAVIAGIPDQIRIVYKKELEKIPIFGWGLKFGKTYISIDRGRGQDAVQSLEEAVNKIRSGASVILFAEGTRTTDGKVQPFKRGPFNLAMRAGVPIVPVTLNGSFEVMPRHSWRIRPGVIRLVLAEPVPVPKANGKETEIALRDQVHDIIERNHRNPDM